MDENRQKDLIYFLDVAEQLLVEILMHLQPRLKICYLYGKNNGGTLFVCCREVVRISESPLWEGLLYHYTKIVFIRLSVCLSVSNGRSAETI